MVDQAAPSWLTAWKKIRSVGKKSFFSPDSDRKIELTETVRVVFLRKKLRKPSRSIDPELGVNIVDLGLLYGLRWDEDGTSFWT